MATEFIRVGARVRPSAKYSSNREVLSLDKTNVAIRASDNKMYQFDQIFDKDVDQATVFKEVGKRIIDGALEGINGTIFAYGQTGSGKTHTMLGPAQEEDPFNDVHQKGLMPRCFEYLFQQLEQRQSRNKATFEYTVTCMFVELYNEAITDLLTDSCPTVTIRAEAKNIVLQGAVCETISSFIEATRLLHIGWNNRRVGETAMNKESSRSHAVLTVDVVQTEDGGGVINKREARINLVDLAGSERQSQTKASGTRLKEAGKINQSLGTLGRVIRELSSKGAHIPYRDSKLTLMIRDSLGGNSRTAVIVCVHPDEDYYAESLSTLKFAEHCRMVKNEFHVNRQVTGKTIDALQAKVLELEERLEIAEKMTIQKYEDRIQKIEKERDFYKHEMRALENKEVDDTIAQYDPDMTRTPAHTRQRRRTRFNTPSQRVYLDATRVTQMPFWGDEDATKNKSVAPDTVYALLLSKQEEVNVLHGEKDDLESQVCNQEVMIDQLSNTNATLEKEKATLETELIREQERSRLLQIENDKLKVEVEHSKNDLTAAQHKLSQVEEVDELKIVKLTANLKAYKTLTASQEEQLVEKKQEIDALKEQLDDNLVKLETKNEEVGKLVGHTNRNQRISMMDNYRFKVKNLENEKKQLQEANDRLHKEISRLKATCRL